MENTPAERSAWRAVDFKDFAFVEFKQSSEIGWLRLRVDGELFYIIGV
jgi:hypothetical protein